MERSNLGVKVMFKCMKGGSFQRLKEEVVAGLNWKICLMYSKEKEFLSKTFDNMIKR